MRLRKSEEEKLICEELLQFLMFEYPASALFGNFEN
jgi:hypothetical protein